MAGEGVKVWERVQPDDKLLRFTTHPGEVELAVVHGNGAVVINWAEVEKRGVGGLPVPGDRIASAWALARLLLIARAEGMAIGKASNGPEAPWERELRRHDGC